MEQQTVSHGRTRFPPSFLMRGQSGPEGIDDGDIQDLAGAWLSRGQQQAVEPDAGSAVLAAFRKRRHGRCDQPGLADLDRAFANPSSVFRSPQDIVRHPLLTLDCKREILWRWAWDEYLLDLATADGMPEGEPSRLPEVKAALRVLNTEWTPDPAAPAAFIVHYYREEDSLAA
jgi:hypothetical protein